MSAESSTFDEMFDGSGQDRPAYDEYCRWFDEQPGDWMRRKAREADDAFRRTGITFNVYGEDQAEERRDPLRHWCRASSPRTRMAQASRAGSNSEVRALNSFSVMILLSPAGNRARGPVAQTAAANQ